MLNGGDYEKSMVESLGMIKTRSSSLMEEAAKSHIHEFNMCTHAPSPTYPERSAADTCLLLSRLPRDAKVRQAARAGDAERWRRHELAQQLVCRVRSAKGP